MELLELFTGEDGFGKETVTVENAKRVKIRRGFDRNNIYLPQDVS
jgi:hypothetical protein